MSTTIEEERGSLGLHHPPRAERQGGDMSETHDIVNEDVRVECPKFPDIYESLQDVQEPRKKEVRERNEQRERVYRAVRHILKENFGFDDGVPAEPRHFPGSRMTDPHIARFTAVYGQIVADNWTDPSLGRPAPGADDIEVDGGGNSPPIVVARRFIDAVVEAVQDYTAHADLFRRVFGFLRETGTDGDHHSRPSA
jgi:hypothetical protein